MIGHEAALSGVPLSVSSARANGKDAARDLDLACDWLRAFSLATATDPVPVDVHQLVSDLAQHHRDIHGDDTLVALSGLLRARDDEDGPARLARPWVHGDFGPWNVLSSRDGLEVADWETASMDPG